MEELLEQARKTAEEAEVFAVWAEETDAVFETNRLKQVQTRESSGRALRLIKNGRIGFSASNRINGTNELVEMALEMAPMGAEARFQFPSANSFPGVEVYDRAIENVTEEQMVELGQSLIDAVRKHSPDVICQGSVSKNTVRVEIMNSNGGRAAYRKSVYGFGIEGLLVRGTDMLFVGDAESSCHPLKDSRRVAEATIQQLEWARETAPALDGQLPVIFTPNGVAGALVAPLALAINGKVVYQGASPLGHRMGEKVLDAGISIWDDATVDYRPGSRLCDDEGIPSRRTPLIDRGVVANFIYDLQTAGLCGSNSTGNASRGLANLPGPSLSTVLIGTGDATFEDMLAGIKEGLVVEQLMGASQGNVLGGDFSGNVLLGYMVKDGRIIGRVKDTMVSGNVYEALKEGVVIGREAKWVGGRLSVPHIMCPRLAVSTRR